MDLIHFDKNYSSKEGEIAATRTAAAAVVVAPNVLYVHETQTKTTVTRMRSCEKW